MLSSSASAESFDRIPDLAQLVPDPVRGTYLLACSTNVGAAQLAGFSVVPRPGGPIRLDGFNTLTLVLMVNPAKPTDKIATNILIHLCIESETDYIIVSRGSVPIPRDTDPDNIMGGSKRSAIPQKTRTR